MHYSFLAIAIVSEVVGTLLLKLSDGSEHRSSRTYAERLDEWLSSPCTATHAYRNRALKP